MRNFASIIFVIIAGFLSPLTSSAQIKAYAWDAHPALTAMVWFRCDKDALQQIDSVAAGIKAQPRGSRVLFLWHDWPDTWNADKGWANMIINGPINIKENRGVLAKVFKWLNALDAAPDRIVLDNESGPTLWTIKSGVEKEMAEVLANREAREKMPELSQFTAEDFNWSSPKSREAFIAFSKWATSKHLEVLRQTKIAAKEAFGRDLPVMNFVELPDGLLDPNGWPTVENSVGGYYTPAAYLTRGGQLISNNKSLKKNARWNQFIYCVNQIRVCAATDKPVVPWVSYPSYAGDNVPDVNPWLWIELQKHLAANGIREVLYWNPKASQKNFDAQSKLAAQTWAGLKPAGTPPKLPQIEWDADEVTTGDVVTRYADFKE